MNNKDKTVVIGLGSPLMADDGLGIAALHELATRWAFSPSVELIDGGTWGMQLLPEIEDADRLLLVDAVNVGKRPGDRVRLERDELPIYFSQHISPHQIDLREVLAAAELRGTLPDETVVIGMQPDALILSAVLSAAVQAHMDEMLEMVLGQLRLWGHESRAESADIYA